MIKLLKKIFKKPNNYEDYLINLLGTNRLNAIDLGAAEGLLPHWKKLDGVAHFFSIEPHSESAKKLREIYSKYKYPDNFLVYELGVSKLGGETTLYKSNVPTGSSILKVDNNLEGTEYFNNEYFYPITEEKIKTLTLSEFVNSNIPEKEFHFIKLDIQGAELEALEGLSGNHLEKLICIESEVAIVNYYKNQTDFQNFHEFMTKNDFKLYDIRVARGAHKSHNGDQSETPLNFFNTIPDAKEMNSRVWELDVTYFKNQKTLILNKDKTGIHRLIIGFLTYNLFTEAYFLIDKASKNNIFSKQEELDLKYELQRYYNNCFNYYWFQPNWLSNILRVIYKRIPFFPSKSWAKYMWVDYPNS